MLHRRSIRLKNYDYSRKGAYFITICTHSNQRFFGEIAGGRMVLSEAGEFARKCWMAIPDHYPDAVLDEWVIMPDHVHGIIIINKQDMDIENPHVGVQNFEPLHGDFSSIRCNKFQHIIPRSIGCIVRGFKIGVTKWFRQRSPGMVVWQRNYYERVIRDQYELGRIRKYIIDNPGKWNGIIEPDF